jgi:aminoglycoside phosphotransferase (APT) family kinase protein
VTNLDGHRVFGWWELDGRRFRRQDPDQDPALPGLPVWLRQGQLRSYRVGRRALVTTRTDNADLCVKVVEPRKLPRLARRHRAAEAAARSAGPAFPLTPRVLAEDESLGSLGLERLTGRALHEVLMDSPEQAGAALARTGQALAAFHAVRTAHLDLPSPGDTRPLSVWARFVALYDDDLADECAGTLAALNALPEGPFGPVDRLRHGDLHDKNILLSSDRVALLDLDSLSRGDPAEDLGNLAAHLVLRALQRGDAPLAGREHAGALMDGYRGGGGTVPSAAVTAVAARTLFRLACIYRFRRIWIGTPRLLLAEARQCAETDLIP